MDVIKNRLQAAPDTVPARLVGSECIPWHIPLNSMTAIAMLVLMAPLVLLNYGVDITGNAGSTKLWCW
jgi:1-acyl-sn-glycerol-3-phosphate acyltransferase